MAQVGSEEVVNSTPEQEPYLHAIVQDRAHWYSLLRSGQGLFRPHRIAPVRCMGLSLNSELEITGDRMDAEILYCFVHDYPDAQSDFFQELITADSFIKARQYLLATIGLGVAWRDRVDDIQNVYETLDQARFFLDNVPSLEASLRYFSPQFPIIFSQNAYLQRTFPLDYRRYSRESFSKVAPVMEHELAWKQAGLKELLPTLEDIVAPWKQRG